MQLRKIKYLIVHSRNLIFFVIDRWLCAMDSIMHSIDHFQQEVLRNATVCTRSAHHLERHADVHQIAFGRCVGYFCGIKANLTWLVISNVWRQSVRLWMTSKRIHQLSFACHEDIAFDCVIVIIMRVSVQSDADWLQLCINIRKI